MTIINNGVRKFTGKAATAKKVWYFIRPVKALIGSSVLSPAFQTEGGVTYSGDNIDEQTKIGRTTTKPTGERSIELTQYFILNDGSIKVVEDAKKNGDSVKVWHIVIDRSVVKVVDGLEDVRPYPAEFDHGVPDDVEIQDGGDLVEASYTLNVIGKLQEGKFPLSNAGIAAIEALYDYQNPEGVTEDSDRIQAVAALRVGKVTSTNTDAKIELS